VSGGMRVVWEKGPREPVTKTERGKTSPMLGKNQGPIFKQRVVKRYVPKG